MSVTSLPDSNIEISSGTFGGSERVYQVAYRLPTPEDMEDMYLYIARRDLDRRNRKDNSMLVEISGHRPSKNSDDEDQDPDVVLARFNLPGDQRPDFIRYLRMVADELEKIV
jgi:hypothetical protein